MNFNDLKGCCCLLSSHDACYLAAVTYIRSFYGEYCVLDDCQRLEQDSDVLHPFILNSVESTITSAYTCENNNTCYEVDTSANVTQYPVMFPENRSELILLGWRKHIRHKNKAKNEEEFENVQRWHGV